MPLFLLFSCKETPELYFDSLDDLPKEISDQLIPLPHTNASYYTHPPTYPDTVDVIPVEEKLCACSESAKVTVLYPVSFCFPIELPDLQHFARYIYALPPADTARTPVPIKQYKYKKSGATPDASSYQHCVTTLGPWVGDLTRSEGCYGDVRYTLDFYYGAHTWTGFIVNHPEELRILPPINYQTPVCTPCDGYNPTHCGSNVIVIPDALDDDGHVGIPIF